MKIEQVPSFGQTFLNKVGPCTAFPPPLQFRQIREGENP